MEDEITEHFLQTVTSKVKVWETHVSTEYFHTAGQAPPSFSCPHLERIKIRCDLQAQTRIKTRFDLQTLLCLVSSCVLTASSFPVPLVCGIYCCARNRYPMLPLGTQAPSVELHLMPIHPLQLGVFLEQ